MRNISKTIERIEEATWGRRETRPSSAVDKPKPGPQPSPRVWRAAEPADMPRQANAAEREAHRQFEKATNILAARSVKLTVPLSSEAVAALVVRDGVPRMKLTITYEGGVLRTEVAAKSVRKAQRVLAENGPDTVFCMLQGKLVKGEISECGLTAQLKTSPKPASSDQPQQKQRSGDESPPVR